MSVRFYPADHLKNLDFFMIFHFNLWIDIMDSMVCMDVMVRMDLLDCMLFMELMDAGVALNLRTFYL